MHPRIIHMPLSGGDRKHQAKEMRRALGMHNELMRQAAIAREEGEAKIQRAAYLECDAWNALLKSGADTTPSPTIAQCLNARITLLEIRCERCCKIDRINETIKRDRPSEVVPDLAGRDAFDASVKNFAVLVEEDSSNDGLPTLYFKLSDTDGDWSEGFTFATGGGGGGGSTGAFYPEDFDGIGDGTVDDTFNCPRQNSTPPKSIMRCCSLWGSPWHRAVERSSF